MSAKFATIFFYQQFNIMFSKFILHP
uniref:Uncharacterized protein n=1 Tax=Arundo donax TaxID=35708 RepID=A0A0A8Z0G8_ARUDO